MISAVNLIRVIYYNQTSCQEYNNMYIEHGYSVFTIHVQYRLPSVL